MNKRFEERSTFTNRTSGDRERRAGGLREAIV
jgi:hypothetical protein